MTQPVSGPGSTDSSRPAARADSGPGQGGATGSALVRSSTVVAAGTLLSRLTGLLRTGMLVYALGAGSIAKSYNLANSTPNMIYDLLLGGILSATLVPVLVGTRDRDDDNGTDAVITVATVVLVAITVLAFIGAPIIVHLYGFVAGFGRTPPSSADNQAATTLLRLFAPQVLFYGLTTLGSALLNTRRRFAAAAFAPVLNNVMLIIVLLVASRAITASSSVEQLLDDRSLMLLLGLGTTAGIVAMALVLWPAIIRAGVRLHWRFDLHHPAVRQVGRLSGWTLGYVVANQITMFVIVSMALGDQEASVSVWNYAYQFFQLPYGVFTVSIMTAFTPELAGLADRAEWARFRDRFLLGLRLVSMVLLPASVLFVLLARPIVAVVFEHTDRYTPGAADLTAATVAALAWGMVGFSLYLYVLRAFYALKDTRTPFYVNLFENAITIVFAFALIATDHGVEGLAWAWSLAYTISAVIAFVLLRRRIRPIGLEPAARTTAALLCMVGAAAVTAVVVWVITARLPTTGTGALATVVIAGIAGVTVYLGLLLVLGVSDVRDLPAVVGRRTAAAEPEVERSADSPDGQMP